MKERYIPIRPGILEYLLRGDISAFEFGVYVIIHLQADYGTGLWQGSAPRILNSAPRGAKLREVQRALEHLSELGLLKHFHQHGKRGNFPFLINKFTVRSGALTGMRLNAGRSESWQSPMYESCADVDTDDSADVRAQDAPIQEVRRKKEQGREKQSAATAGAAQPVAFQSDLLTVNQAQDLKLADVYPWVDRPQEYGKMALWLEANRPGRKVRNALAFCMNWFNKIPCSSKGGTRGKADINEAVAVTMQGAAINARRPN